MSLIDSATQFVERTALPDSLTKLGIAQLVARTHRRLLHTTDSASREFAEAMAERPIAEFTGDANQQHYELPPEFFGLVLGPRRKYSCCLFGNGAETLAQAEDAALQSTADHAALADGQRILELGCGWGSLSLWMAARYPVSEIVAVSNSAPQGSYIREKAAAEGLTNLTVITADMNSFTPEGSFDRIVSIEMFEHMANWSALLGRIRTWLRADGRLFLHVFTHRRAPYRFDHRDPADWIARHFFTGGIMPSHDLIRHVEMPFTVERDWHWNGRHYQQTALDWLANMDANDDRVAELMHSVYGADAKLWQRRWRLFFLATAGLFGHDSGQAWGVSHYRLAPLAAH